MDIIIWSYLIAFTHMFIAVSVLGMNVSVSWKLMKYAGIISILTLPSVFFTGFTVSDGTIYGALAFVLINVIYFIVYGAKRTIFNEIKPQ